ncbi:NIPSNAP family protein [Bradyrhizobium sp. TZ2]
MEAKVPEAKVETRPMKSAQQAEPGVALDQPCSPIVDLRQYTLFPETRDAFIELFDREFVETQEAVGIRVIGQFRDLGDPNRFVWMRGFADMPSRERALTAFYVHGAAWKAHSETARAMMIDSTDALLLHPVRANEGFKLDPPSRRPTLESAPPAGLIVATVYSLNDAPNAGFTAFFEDVATPQLINAGASMLPSFETEPSPNNFPRLPLREGENILVSFCGFESLSRYHDHMTALGRNQRWRGEVAPALRQLVRGRPQTLRLVPTSRSQLRA